MAAGSRPGRAPIEHEIVGVAADLRHQDLRAPAERLAYVSWFQGTEVRLSPFEFVVRTSGNPAALVNPVRSEIQRLRPDAPILAIRTMAETINGRLLSERVLAALGSFFAIVALTLAAIGVYGLLAHLVARRVPEIGVRLALGARPAEMMWATLRDNAVLAAIGCAIGLTAAFIGLRVLDGMLFGLAPTDVTTLGSAALILLLVSLAAAFLPARRAASVDPLVALRYE